MKRTRPRNAFLLVGISPAGEKDAQALAALVEWFERQDWPVAFVMEPGPRAPGPSRPGAGDLIIQTHLPSLAREPGFMNLYQDFGEPQLILAGAWERNFLIGTVVDLYLAGHASGLVQDATRLVEEGELLPVGEVQSLLRGFSYGLTVADLHEKERIWWF